MEISTVGEVFRGSKEHESREKNVLSVSYVVKTSLIIHLTKI